MPRSSRLNEVFGITTDARMYDRQNGRYAGTDRQLLDRSRLLGLHLSCRDELKPIRISEVGAGTLGNGVQREVLDKLASTGGDSNELVGTGTCCASSTL